MSNNSLEQLQQLADNLKKSVEQTKQILDTANDSVFSNLTDEQRKEYDKYKATIQSAIEHAKNGNTSKAQEIIKNFSDGRKNNKQ